MLMVINGTVLPDWMSYIWAGAYLGGFIVWGGALEVARARRLRPNSTEQLSTKFALVTAGYVLTLGLATSLLVWPIFAQCFAAHLVIGLIAFAVTKFAVESHRNHALRIERWVAKLEVKAQEKRQRKKLSIEPTAKATDDESTRQD